MAKRTIISILALFILLLSLTGCDLLFLLGDIENNDGNNGYLDDFDEPHECVFTEWEVLCEPTCISEGKEWALCDICYEEGYRPIPKGDHTVVYYEELPPTCTDAGVSAGSECSVCHEVFSGLEPIAEKGHTYVIDPAIPVTDTTIGRTEGEHCSDCGEIFRRQASIFPNSYSNPDMYHDDYAYESLSNHANGDAMRAFYMEIDEAASAFHSSLVDAKIKENGEKRTYYVAELAYSDNGISSAEAFSAWNAYVKDHPLYYWISNEATYTSDYLTLVVDSEYADGDVREEINLEIYNTVEQYLGLVGDYVDPYNITLCLHDSIILNADYAFMADGVTPSTENWAHNITGVLLEGKGVCESYTKVFQLLLNYCDIENIYVIGSTEGGAHAWNLVQLDDGEWYWYDLTWDDQPRVLFGISYNYFCISNTDDVEWVETQGRYRHFLETHIPDQSCELGANYSYRLPEAAQDPYEYDGFKVYDDIIDSGDGLSYYVIGFNMVALNKIDIDGIVHIPETVVADEIEFTVVAIGVLNSENKTVGSGSVLEYDFVLQTQKHNVTEIHIPRTIFYISDRAFDYCKTIREFVVNTHNPKFLSANGVLYTKSLYTLIKYPLAKTDKEYTVMPMTVEIADQAFGGSVFIPEHLEKITIPSSVCVVGAFGGYAGYRDETPINPDHVYVRENYLGDLQILFGVENIIIENDDLLD